MVNTMMQFGPTHTPKIIWQLVVTFVVASLASALWDSLFTLLLGAPRLLPFLALSKWGISNFFLWQFGTFLFVGDSYGSGITLFYLIYLFFTAYIFWMIGSQIVEFAGRRHFLQLFFVSGIGSGVVGVLLLWLFGTDTFFSGPTPALLALFTVWTFLNPELELLIFFVIPLRIKWLFAIVVGAIVLINLSQLNLITLAYCLTAVFSGYLFATMRWELYSPFPLLRPVDSQMMQLKDRLMSWRKPKVKKSGSKIIQLFSGKPELDDDAFIDAMLTKISENGQESLTWAEKKRMDQIAAKRNQRSN